MRSLFYRRAFTLVELLVSMAILVMLSLLLIATTNSTASTWRNTTAKIEQFRSAGDAFESMTRRISQATLNTYWDYFNASGQTRTTANSASFVPKTYGRQSDLRFIAGDSQALIGNSPPHPTHSIFFQAPLGYVDDLKNFGGLDNLLNTWGYYIEFNKEDRPAFLDGLSPAPPQRYRYRLMEMMQPSTNLSIYGLTSANNSGTPYTGHDWFTNGLLSTPPTSHALAENVIAMIILPKLSKSDDSTGTKLAPNYSYDSAPSPGATSADPSIDPKNQLPPVVQVTLVAIDETSANRIARGSAPPGFDSTLSSLFKNASSFDTDLAALEAELTKEKINYRVFTSNISIRGAKWSRN